MDSQHFVNKLNKDFFNGALSPEFTAKLSLLPIDRPDVYAMVQRMFGLMNKAGFPAQDLSIMVGEVLGTLLSRILPGAWEGRVPPITIPGRHKAVDQYIKKRMKEVSGTRSMLDIGCGFPPYTTLETSEALTGWQITAADPSLPTYLVYDEDGNYATFDEEKALVYFQPAIPNVENWNNLLSDTDRTRARFKNLLTELLNSNGKEFTGNCRLETDPVLAYETDKLSFVRGGIGEAELEPADCIRCFNVLYYFDNDFYQNALKWFESKLNEGGMLLVGGNWALSSECYYHEYQKINGRLMAKEFAFSIDALCPFGILTWYGNYDDNLQTGALAKYLTILRQDKPFMDAFYMLNDELRAKYGVCPRDTRGYYGDADPALSPEELWLRVAKVVDELNEAGFNQKAAEVLKKAGLEARVNEVGHIAIRLDNPKH